MAALQNHKNMEKDHSSEDDVPLVSAAAPEDKYLQEVHAQLLDAQMRLQNRWLTPEKPHTDSFSSLSTAVSDAGDGSAASSSGFKCVQPQLLSVPTTAGPHHCQDTTPNVPIVSSNVAGLNRTNAIVCEIKKELVDGHLWVHWPVDAKKLRSKDRQIISPSFEIIPGAVFKLMMMPKMMGEKKGQACFQKAHGCGSIVLKHVAPVEGTTSLSKLIFRITVGDGKQRQTPRGPVDYDFGSGVCGLPKRDELWDFLAAVNADSSTLTVSLELLTDCASGRSQGLNDF